MRNLIIDCFAGGGGASVGIEMALGRLVDIAINHDPDAILMHKTILMTEEHYDCESKSRPDWCPLKELPEKSTIENDMTDYQCGMVDGRNQCIDEITGGEVDD